VSIARPDGVRPVSYTHLVTGEALDGVHVGEVEDVAVDVEVGIGAGEFRLESLETILAARGEDERVSMGSELACKFHAQPGGGAGDEGCATVEEFHNGWGL